MKNASHKQQQGIVIVMALFIMALVATMAYVMMARLDRDTQRTTLILRNTDAELYAQGSIAWARDALRNNWENQRQNTLIDVVPIQSPVNSVNNYKIQSTIYDMQSRFNLNNVTDRNGQAAFIYLIQTVAPKIEQQQAVDVAEALTDWISPGSADNVYAKYYGQLPAPYRTAHRPMLSASELRMVKGVTPDLFNALQPYVTALPTGTFINVQTASVPVLRTLSPTLTLDAAKAIAMARAQKPFTTLEMFSGLDAVKNFNIPTDKVTVTSNYFLLETVVTIEKQQVVLYTLLERVAKDRKANVNIIWQSRGIW